jgi:hypothetical protein
MKKTYRHSRRSHIHRVNKKYTAHKARKAHKSRKTHKSRRLQKGGNYNYEIDISTNSNIVFVTHKIRPRTIYRIDLRSKTFSVFTAGHTYETYPLEKIYNRTLFKILSNAKRNDQVFDDLLISHGINNIEYYTGDEHFIRDRKKRYNQELREIEEIEEELLSQPPNAVVEQVDVLQELPPIVSPHSSPRSKTVKNRALSRSTKEGLREAIKIASVITDDNIDRLRSGNVRVRTAAPTIVAPSFRLPVRDRPPFKP